MTHRTVTAALIALLAGPAAAQLELDWSEGVVGGYWRLDLGWPAPGGGPQVYFLLPSFDDGPTPLSTIDPGNPNSLSVATDLLPLLRSGSVIGTGAKESFALPTIPALVGQDLHAQFFTVPGPASLVDGISNAVRMRATVQGETWLASGEVGSPRRHHTLTLLPDGRVIVLGGVAAGGSTLVRDAERYDPQVQDMEPAGKLLTPRAHHSATLLADGRVLVAGGLVASGNVTPTCELYDPQTGLSTAAASMARARTLHAAVALADGRVLVAGGSAQYNATDPIGFPGSLLGTLVGTIEVYDPLADTWKTLATFPSPRTGVRATLQKDKTVLITGGVRRLLGQLPATTVQTFVFDPSSDSLAPAVPLPKALALHQQILTEDGETLVVGGGTLTFGPTAFAGSKSCFRIGAGAGAWTPTASTQGIVACGELICVPRPIDIKFPIGVGAAEGGGPLYVWGDGREVVYFAGGGITDLSFAGGSSSVTHNTAYLRIFEDFVAWDVPATMLFARPGGRLVATDEGRRIMTIGAPATPVGTDHPELLTLP